jgi:hypothetical protein
LKNFFLSRLDRHSLEISATVFKDILIGHSGRSRLTEEQIKDFEEIGDIVSSS